MTEVVEAREVREGKEQRNGSGHVTRRPDPTASARQLRRQPTRSLRALPVTTCPASGAAASDASPAIRTVTHLSFCY